MVWAPFPYPDTRYLYTGNALQDSWERLHRGDCEPIPSRGDVCDAWRCYHAGDFSRAVEIGLACGLAGYNAANKAATVYASYLETADERKRSVLLEVAQRCEAQQERTPGDVNGWYLHAFALGRYSQSISVVKALAQGLGSKIKNSLTRAIQLAPRHADAHVALGTYHAEVIDKVGELVGRLTYGASKNAVRELFESALQFNAESAIARMEFGNALVMLYGKSRMKDAERLYQEATALVPMDAMERLDVESAKAELAG